jgi:hypothetical protein
VVWRTEDTALLARLEDDQILERLWKSHVGTAHEPPHPRAAGMFPFVWSLAGGEAARRASLAVPPELSALSTLLEPDRLSTYPPELVHHLALYYGRIADAVESDTPESAARARVRSVAAWLHLGTERVYLDTLSRSILGGSLGEADATRASGEIPFDVIEDLGKSAAAGARTLSNPAKSALRALGRVGEACRIAAASDSLKMKALQRAEARRADAIEAALAPIGEGLVDASNRGVLTREAEKLLPRAVLVWAWTEYDEAVEHFVVDQITPIAWEVYRDLGWDDLRRLLAPYDVLVNTLAARIASDPSRIAYAAPCAQMLLWRAELESTLPRQIEAAERVLALCHSHRNGRVVMAGFLCDAALQALDATRSLVQQRECASAEAYLARAEKLWPTAKNLVVAKARLAEAKLRSGGRS